MHFFNRAFLQLNEHVTQIQTAKVRSLNYSTGLPQLHLISFIFWILVLGSLHQVFLQQLLHNLILLARRPPVENVQLVERACFFVVYVYLSVLLENAHFNQVVKLAQLLEHVYFVLKIEDSQRGQDHRHVHDVEHLLNHLHGWPCVENNSGGREDPDCHAVGQKIKDKVCADCSEYFGVDVVAEHAHHHHQGHEHDDLRQDVDRTNAQRYHAVCVRLVLQVSARDLDCGEADDVKQLKAHQKRKASP